MKNGSIVHLKEDFFSEVEEMITLSNMGYPLLLHNTPYQLSCDPIEYTCKHCGNTHFAIELEEFPGLALNGEHFVEVLSSEEVKLEELLEN